METPDEWVTSITDGKHKCKHCSYKTNSKKFLRKHKWYHNRICKFILYMECSGSLAGRNAINDNVSVHAIDCTGGQAAYD